MKLVVLAAAGCVCTASSLAGVFVTSRVTVSREFLNDYFEPNEPFEYDNTDTFRGLGTHNITMPKLYEAESTVTHSLMYAKFTGLKHQRRYDQGYSSVMTTMFNVSDAAASVFITLNGRADMGSQKPANPQYINAFFLIYNMANNQLVFNSWDIGDHVFGEPGKDRTTWTNATWSSQLAPGSYKVVVSASGVHTDNFGTDHSVYGTGDITATMTMIPTVSTCGILVPVGMWAARRKR